MARRRRSASGRPPSVALRPPVWDAVELEADRPTARVEPPAGNGGGARRAARRVAMAASVAILTVVAIGSAAGPALSLAIGGLVALFLYLLQDAGAARTPAGPRAVTTPPGTSLPSRDGSRI